ncbi:phosphatidylinositol-specific phospholipase C/glycerophosphodiester phosphodiesterase family protein [Vibrio sp. Isolate24]|uniref:phosphatidylinositol-specific phospholipase C/glycerophosphodiester phosphodiesterase family protein n=1 Tax=Vibrio sp. Isolate24 TaxID=2908534 RepID=UPI001EFCBA4D|nr:phosphatidylinositol-specific phospholipase C/glycerophosphodiester phosphodiesterase family protein [Vibrio sp. Isolate24]MCG9680101.1 phosphatidylinositol-specific phospholipase C/glycerophosphodiester phosphodiesterase family protein [Vibrio sp. Isolate24]
MMDFARLVRIVLIALSCLVLSACDETDSEIETEITETVRSHSHNDYYREEPFHGAAELGFGSFEADVYYKAGYEEVLIAHDEDDLVNEWKFDELYVQPIVNHVRNNQLQMYDGWDYTAVLLIDIKTQAAFTWQAVEKVLKQYPDVFSRYENGKVYQGPVTAIISGNRPIELMQQQQTRYSFVDGRLSDLDKGYSPTLMPLISNNFDHFDQEQFGNFDGTGEWPEEALAELERIITTAHANKQKIRFWATPEDDAETRDTIWGELTKANVDYINTDLLQTLHDWLLVNDPHPDMPGLNWLDHPDWQPMD